MGGQFKLGCCVCGLKGYGLFPNSVNLREGPKKSMVGPNIELSISISALFLNTHLSIYSKVLVNMAYLRLGIGHVTRNDISALPQ